MRDLQETAELTSERAVRDAQARIEDLPITLDEYLENLKSLGDFVFATASLLGHTHRFGTEFEGGRIGYSAGEKFRGVEISGARLNLDGSVRVLVASVNANTPRFIDSGIEIAVRNIGEFETSYEEYELLGVNARNHAFRPPRRGEEYWEPFTEEDEKYHEVMKVLTEAVRVIWENNVDPLIIKLGRVAAEVN